jgi:TolA-binding protein
MLDRPDRKIESLDKIIAGSEGPYVADAMYELGRTYTGMQRYREGAVALQRFIKAYPSAPHYTAALLDLGLIYQNLGDPERALEYYRMVVGSEKYSDMAVDAMNGIRGIYVDRGDVGAYFEYAKEVGIETDLGVVQRDSLAFVSAQKVFLSGDSNRAATALDDYLQAYPDGTRAGNALFYAGENALSRGRKEDALGYFERLSGMYNNDFTAQGLERTASLGMELGRYPLAAEAYDRLSRMAPYKQKKDRALAGLLRARVLTGKDDEIIGTADDIMTRTDDRNVLREARFVKAKALSRRGDTAEALPLFRELSADVTSPEGAEGAYRVIEAAYLSDNNAEAERLVYELAEKNTPHAYWLGMAFLTLGDMYARAGDSFQARATFQSVVDGYPDREDGIIAEAEARIKRLK